MEPTYLTPNTATPPAVLSSSASSPHQSSLHTAAPARINSLFAWILRVQAQSSDVMCAGDVVSAFGAKTETSREFSRQMRIISTGLGPDGLFEATVDGAERNVVMQVHDRSPLGWEVCMYGTRWSVLSRRPRFAELSSHMLPPPPSPHEGALLSPMPGVLVSIAVGAGDMVVAGQQLCVVEAMKMQNVILAERNAVVQKVFVDVGATLATDDPIVAFEP